jgi:hypothetical protein
MSARIISSRYMLHTDGIGGSAGMDLYEGRTMLTISGERTTDDTIHRSTLFGGEEGRIDYTFHNFLFRLFCSGGVGDYRRDM